MYAGGHDGVLPSIPGPTSRRIPTVDGPPYTDRIGACPGPATGRPVDGIRTREVDDERQ